jgi:hemerythrin-like domain-containing protein
MAGFSRREYIMRSQLGETTTTEDIKRYRQQCTDHLLRMDNTRLPEIAKYYEPKGRRDVQRPEEEDEEEETEQSWKRNYYNGLTTLKESPRISKRALELKFKGKGPMG